MDNNSFTDSNTHNEQQNGFSAFSYAADSGTKPSAIRGASLSRRIKTSGFDKLAMVLNFFLTFFFVRNLLADISWKLCAAYLGIFALATAFITVKQKRFNAQAAFSGVLCVALSFSLALRDNPDEFNFWAIILLIYLSGSYCLALTGANRHERGSYFFFLDILKTEFLLPLRHFFLPYASMHHTRLDKKESSAPKKRKPRKKYSAAIIGILCAVPVLLVVFPLLVKSDAAFESIAGSIEESIHRFLNVFFSQEAFSRFFEDYIFVLVPTLFIAPYIFSVMFSFRHGVADEENKDTSKKYAKLRVGSPALFSGFLGVICLLYVIYLLSQSVYIFSAFGGTLPKGVNLSISEYARRGFFELAGVATVNLVLIALTVLFSRRNENGSFKTVIKAFDLFLCFFNILLSAVSISKIVLYMSEMGLTHRRIYVFVFDIVMIIAFLCVAVRLIKKEFPYMRVITAAACIAVTALSLVGVDRIIAEYNTEKYLSGELHAESVGDITDGFQLGAFESVLKIAKSETDLSKDAKYSMQYYVVSSTSSFWQMQPMQYKDGKITMYESSNTLFGDAARALKAANAETELIEECLIINNDR